jgi:YD repeat-containing protein
MRKYISIFGDDPKNSMTIYSYNKKGQKVKEVRYTFGKEGYYSSKKPSATIVYKYSGDLLVKMDDGKSLTIYEYDSRRNKVREVTSIKAIKGSKIITEYKYDDNGRLLEESGINQASAFDRRYFRYEYDAEGRLVKKLAFSADGKTSEVLWNYEYDKEETWY